VKGTVTSCDTMLHGKQSGYLVYMCPPHIVPASMPLPAQSAVFVVCHYLGLRQGRPKSSNMLCCVYQDPQLSFTCCVCPGGKGGSNGGAGAGSLGGFRVYTSPGEIVRGSSSHSSKRVASPCTPSASATPQPRVLLVDFEHGHTHTSHLGYVLATSKHDCHCLHTVGLTCTVRMYQNVLMKAGSSLPGHPLLMD
jgi:hypothetical protein